MVATQITFSNDVGVVSTASNASGSIRWHVYTRTSSGTTGIYVQRETPPGTLEAEVQFISNGDKPRIAYDATISKWLLIYEFNEQSWLLLIDETTPPSTRPAQDQTMLIHFRTGAGDTDYTDIASTQAMSSDSFPGIDAYSAPAEQAAVGVGASPTGIQFYRVRWVPQNDPSADHFNANIVGFNVYVRRAETGHIQKLNPIPIPFTGFKIYEYEVPAVGGTYMVTQVEHEGLGAAATREGRIGAPKDEVPSALTPPPPVIQSIMGRACGEGFDAPSAITDDYDIIFLPLTLDTFPSHGGEGFDVSSAITDDYDIIFLPLTLDTFPSHGGEGHSILVEQSGYTPIIIG